MQRTFRKPVDGALSMFGKGFKVFPLKPNEKVPAVKDWQKWAETATERKIQEYGIANPLHNWGVYCGVADLMVLDFDKKNGRDGFKTLDEITANNGKLPATLTVRTPTGGKHMYYKAENPKSSVDKVGRGIDTRGKGGYVVAPYSRIDDREYEIEADNNIVYVPEWFLNLLPKKEDAPKPINKIIPKGEQHATLVSLAGTMRKRGMDFNAINAALQEVNDNNLEEPAPKENIELIAKSICQYQPDEALTASDFLTIKPMKAVIGNTVKQEDVPPRDWVMKNRYVGGYISVIISPGGLGKSTLSMLDAVAIATGNNFTNETIVKPGTVWLYNTEDPMPELKRRLLAIQMQYKIPLDALKNIHLTSGRDSPLILVKAGKDGLAINKQVLNDTIAYIKDNNIVLFLADPFIRTHEVNENDNMQIDKVVWCFQRIADATGCAVGLIHHTRKPSANNQNTGDMHTARGASSLINAARIAHTVSGMTETEAKKFALSESRRSWYIRLDNAKANLQAPSEAALWFEKKSITLLNTDSVGTLEKVNLKDMRDSLKKEEQLMDIEEFGEFLDLELNIGEMMSVRDVFNRLLANGAMSHLVKAEHPRRGMPRIMSMVGKRLIYKNKIFSCEFINSKRHKHWVRCKENLEYEEDVDNYVVPKKEATIEHTEEDSWLL